MDRQKSAFQWCFSLKIVTKIALGGYLEINLDFLIGSAHASRSSALPMSLCRLCALSLYSTLTPSARQHLSASALSPAATSPVASELALHAQSTYSRTCVAREQRPTLPAASLPQSHASSVKRPNT